MQVLDEHVDGFRAVRLQGRYLYVSLEREDRRHSSRRVGNHGACTSHVEDRAVVRKLVRSPYLVQSVVQEARVQVARVGSTPPAPGVHTQVQVARVHVARVQVARVHVARV